MIKFIRFLLFATYKLYTCGSYQWLRGGHRIVFAKFDQQRTNLTGRAESSRINSQYFGRPHSTGRAERVYFNFSVGVPEIVDRVCP